MHVAQRERDATHEICPGRLVVLGAEPIMRPRRLRAVIAVERRGRFEAFDRPAAAGRPVGSCSRVCFKPQSRHRRRHIERRFADPAAFQARASPRMTSPQQSGKQYDNTLKHRMVLPICPTYGQKDRQTRRIFAVCSPWRRERDACPWPRFLLLPRQDRTSSLNAKLR